MLWSSHYTCWLLCVASPLLPYRLAPPSRPLVAPAGCCMLHPSVPPFFLHCLLVFLSCWLVVACRIASVALSCYAAFASSRHACVALSPSRGHDSSVTLSSWATLPCLGRPILLCCTLTLSSPLSPYYVAPHSFLSSHWWLLHVYLVHGLLLGGGGCEWMTESCLSPFTCVRMSTASAQTMATMMRCLISCNSLV